MRSTLITALISATAGAIAALAVVLFEDSSPPADTGESGAAEIERIVRAVLDAEAEQTAAAESEAAELIPAPAEPAEVEAAEPAFQERVVAAYDRVAPSIVLIDAEGPEQIRADGVVYRPASLATGIILDAEGNIVTAAHVIEGMERIDVVFADGRRHPATLISSDAPFSDVAVLSVDAADFRPAPFGSSAELTIGDTVLAVGNILLGEEIAMTLGVVSHADIQFSRERFIQRDLIQTDAALNHGNSGGALVNLQGEVVGLTTVVARETQDGDFVDGVGFAIQIDPVLEIARTIAADGYYPRPTFGVVDERLLTPAAAAQLGLDVSEGSFLLEIKRSGVFARAGIRPGDVIRAIDGVPLNADTPFVNALSALRPGRPVEVVVHREGREQRFTLTPERRLP